MGLKLVEDGARARQGTELTWQRSGEIVWQIMSMKMKLLTMVAALALAVLQSGCLLFVAGAAAAAGVGTYAYVSGELKGSEAVSLDRAWDASQAAMKDLQFPITIKSKDALQAELVARTAADKKVTVRLKKVSEGTTEIRIRVGTFGDESTSRLILEKIKSHL